MRKAVSNGGDSDTIACITGGMAQASYGSVPSFIEEEVRGMLPGSLDICVVYYEALEYNISCIIMVWKSLDDLRLRLQ